MTSEIQLEESSNGKNTFVIGQGNTRVAEMEFNIEGGNMTVYHTQVSGEVKGQGVGTRLLDHMVHYARQNKLKVIPLCRFVAVHFERHPEKYEDIWVK